MEKRKKKCREKGYTGVRVARTLTVEPPLISTRQYPLGNVFFRSIDA
jgi:hypothetical protein